MEAIYVGLFANETMPLRAGELIRCFLLSQTQDSAFCHIRLRPDRAHFRWRLADGVLFHLPALGQLPGVLVKGGYVLGVLIVVCCAVLGYAMYAKKQSIDLFSA